MNFEFTNKPITEVFESSKHFESFLTTIDNTTLWKDTDKVYMDENKNAHNAETHGSPLTDHEKLITLALSDRSKEIIKLCIGEELDEGYANPELEFTYKLDLEPDENGFFTGWYCFGGILSGRFGAYKFNKDAVLIYKKCYIMS